MSLDRSLKGKRSLERHRNVLKRAERIELLEDNEKWEEGKSPIFGLVKVAHRKTAAKAEATEAGATATAVPTAGASGGAAPGTAKAPAAGKASGADAKAA